MDFSNQLFRCSSLGNLMTNQQGKKDTKSLDELSETTKKELLKIYIHAVYGRDKEIHSKYLEKGLAVEEDAFTLISRVKHIMLKKNEDRFQNDFLIGEPDTTDPLYDAKSCWDLHTFMLHKTQPLKKDYDFQMNGYCELLGKNWGTVAFCLVDTPEGLINDEKNRLFYKMNVVSRENPDYLTACDVIDKEMRFDDIPLEQRLYEVEVKRSPELIESVYKRVPLWRTWLSEFASKWDVKAVEVIA